MSKLSIRRNGEQILKPWTVYSGTGSAQNTLGRFVTWRGALDFVLRRRELQRAAGREDYWFSGQARDAGWRKLGGYGDQEQLTTIEQIPSCGADEPRTR